MGWILDLSRIERNQVFSYILFVASLIMPGLGYVYFAHRAVFENSEIIRLLLISVFYSLPFLLFGMLHYNSLNINKAVKEITKDKTKIDTEFLSYIALFSMIVYLVPLSFYMFNIAGTRAFVERYFNGTLYFFIIVVFTLVSVQSIVIRYFKSLFAHKSSYRELKEGKN